MDKEFVRLRSLLSGEREVKIDGRLYIEGSLGRHRLVLHQCGIGKVNAAIGATALLSRYPLDAVVSTGVAGGADISLRPLDVVAAAATAYHDVYCGQEVAYGQVIGCPPRFEAGALLLAAARKVAGVKTGLTVTGDWFVDSREKMQDILGHFPDALAVDMESAAIAQVCYQRGVPFLSFRIISDVPLADNKASQYFDFWQRAADDSFLAVQSLLESL